MANDHLQKTLMGAEPNIKAIGSIAQMVRTLSWYSCMCDASEAHKWLLTYVTTYKPEKIKAIKQLSEYDLVNTYGWTARILSRGTMLDQKVIDKLHNYIDSIQPSSSNDNAVISSVKDRIDLYLPDFEQAVDNLDKTFSCYNYLTANKVAQIHATRIAEYYQRPLDELALLLTKSDPQVNEGYRHMARKNQVETHDYIKMIVDDAHKFVGNVKKERRPRKAKVKSAAAILKKFKYMVSHQPMKLSSCSPESIIGASILFTYNTSTNIISMYIAEQGGLTVNRSSIANFDPVKSICKRVGKSADKVIQSILATTGKKQVIGLLSQVSSNQSAASERVNDKIILLKAFK